MRPVLVISTMIMSACTGGVPGPRGPAGPPGPASPGGGAVYKDSTGALLEHGLYHFDANGRVWQIDLETGQPHTHRFLMAWTEPACGGDAYVVSPPPPRYVFRLIGNDIYRARADTGRATERTFASATTADGGCMPYPPDVAIRAVPAPPTDPGNPPITVPLLPYSGPIHQEAAP